MTQTAREDRGLFLQVPYYVIDNLDMTDNAKIGFIRFCRLFNKKDKSIEFRGYYRGLATAIKKSPAHTISIVDQWVKFNLIQREETLDGIILKVNMAAIWERNKTPVVETQQCLNYEQKRLYNGQHENSSVYDINTAVQNINTAVHEINGTIQNLNSSERKKALTRLLDYTRLLLEIEKGENCETSTSGYATATPALSLALVEDDFFFEDTPEQANFAYSHDKPPTTTLQVSPETSIPAESGGYRQESMPIDPPAKPVKPASRQRKPKVEQPVLVDTSKKAVAYNEAEQRVFDWYCGCDFIHAKPEQDANKKKHCGKLAPHVHSQEEMQSLADFTKTWLKAHFKQDVYVVPLGNMAYSDTLNAWIAKQKQAKRASEPAAPQEIDLNKPVLWTRYQHTGPAIKHWFLYEDMPLVEAQQYGYKADVIVPNDRRNIHTSLKALAEGHQTLTPEEQNEKDHAELRLHLVA